MATSFKVDQRADAPGRRRRRRRRRGWAGGSGYGRGPVDPAKVLEAERARQQLLLNIAKVMADNKLEALAFKAAEHQPSLIAEAAFPPYKSMGGVVSLNTFLIYTPVITVPMVSAATGSRPAWGLLGLPYSEPALIRLGYAYEQATHHRVPPALDAPRFGRNDLACRSSGTPNRDLRRHQSPGKSLPLQRDPALFLLSCPAGSQSRL